jgi:hypothetical protein
MRIASGLPLTAALAVSCFAAAGPSVAETSPVEAERGAFQPAGPLYTYGPPYRYAPYDPPRPGWGWRAYEPRNRNFYYRQRGPDWWSYRPNHPYRRYDSWSPRWRPNERGFGPRPWDWRPYY